MVGNLTGQLLVATERMPDPRFMRTVLYMVRHDARGAMGLVLNRPMTEIESNDASGKIRTHYGGPVERGLGFVLHTDDYVGKSTLVINNGVAMTGQPEIWRAIAAGTGPRRCSSSAIPAGPPGSSKPRSEPATGSPFPPMRP